MKLPANDNYARGPGWYARELFTLAALGGCVPLLLEWIVR